MKNSILSIVVLCATLIGGFGCATSSTTSTLAPLVAEIAQARIAMRILDRSPERADTLLAVADAIEVLSAEVSTGEISELAIRTWVSQRAAGWNLIPVEQELLVAGLLSARDAFLKQTGAATISLGDGRLKPWLNAIQRGIRTGVAAHQAQT